MIQRVDFVRRRTSHEAGLNLFWYGRRCLMCFNLVSAKVKKKKTEKGKGMAGTQSTSRNKKKLAKKESTAEDWIYCAAKKFKKCLKPTGL